jgi:predicted oxidoreductase
MKTIQIKNTSLAVSRIGYGCMEIGGDWSNEPPSLETKEKAVAIIETALDQGINFFDHADIYCRGKSETVFSHIWNSQPSLRQKILLQSKCGIRFADDPVKGYPARYDFRCDYILQSVEGILKRLQTDYLDLLLLHRPDILVEPEEVARAFDSLHRAGKVRYFGVSNHNGAQIELLKRYLHQPIVVNQVELNLLHFQLFEEGIIVNQDQPSDPVRGDGTLEYCRLNDIALQAWSPLARGLVSGSAPDSNDHRILNVSALVNSLAKEKQVSPEAIVIAWILMHPAKIQPIIGTTNQQRIKAACEADKVELTREEWYALFTAGRGVKVP